MVQENSHAMVKASDTRSNHLVYLADSDRVFLASTATQIEFYGYGVDQFFDMPALIEAVKERPPSVIVVNMDLGNVDILSQEVLSLANRSYSSPIPIILISTDSSISKRLDAVRAGCKAFFPKPLETAGLVDALDQIVWFVPPAPYKVLIVDDSKVHASFSAMHLRRAGMNVEIINNPMETLRTMDEIQPELVLLDMYMPECTGMELASVIRQIPKHVSIPIVYLSSETDRDRQLEAVSLGGDDFLVKPIKPEHLISSVTSRIERYRTLKELMLKDSLTGLYNHTTIKEHLRQEFARAYRSNSPFSCAVLDLDHFKEVNDKFGHTSGDRVLKSLAQLLVRRLRQADIVGRYGGEEFVILLPGATEIMAKKIIDELRQNFHHIKHVSRDQEFYLSFSGGIASYPRFDSPTLLFEMADRALYQAKQQGRNRILIAD